MFELTAQAATLVSVTPRTEIHGEDRVFAISLGVRLTGPNTMLDWLSPTLRTTLYKAVDGQDQLPGVEPHTPLLRTRGIESLHLVGKLEGWTFTVDHGIDESDPITLGAARIDKFRVMPSEGGSVDLRFRIGSNDVDAEEAGLLCSKLSQEISISLRAPLKVPAGNGPEPIDGTKGHPGAQGTQGTLIDGAEGEAPDEATEAFLDAHSTAIGGGPEDEDEPDDEGGIDVDAGDPLLDDAQAVILADGHASISAVQRHLRIGYNRAARLLEALEAKGVVSAMDVAGRRTVVGGIDAAQGEPARPFPKDANGAEAPPQSVTVETSRAGTRTARGRAKTAAALKAGAEG